MRALLTAIFALRAAAGGAAPLAIEAPARASARLGAARVAVWVVNSSDRPARAVVDPERLAVTARDASGAALACAPAARRRGARALAPGERAGVLVDVGARCGIRSPGEYAVEISLPGSGAPPARVALRVTRWVNPGPRSPPRDGGR
jgi:hypothetical protein